MRSFHYQHRVDEEGRICDTASMGSACSVWYHAPRNPRRGLDAIGVYAPPSLHPSSSEVSHLCERQGLLAKRSAIAGIMDRESRRRDTRTLGGFTSLWRFPSQILEAGVSGGILEWFRKPGARISIGFRYVLDEEAAW